MDLNGRGRRGEAGKGLHLRQTEIPYILPKAVAGRVETASADPFLWFGAEERGDQLVNGDHDSVYWVVDQKNRSLSLRYPKRNRKLSCPGVPKAFWVAMERP